MLMWLVPNTEGKLPGVWAPSSPKDSYVPTGPVLPSSGQNCGLLLPHFVPCFWETVPQRKPIIFCRYLKALTSLGCVSGSQMKQKIPGLQFHASAQVPSLQLSDILERLCMICQLLRPSISI
jgi:hypothetical protein